MGYELGDDGALANGESVAWAFQARVDATLKGSRRVAPKGSRRKVPQA